jgi:Cell division protein CrgA
VSESTSGEGDAAAEPTGSKPKDAAPSRTKESGRATPKGGPTAKQPVASGRYTPPIPRQQRHSPRWFPVVLLGFLVLGLMMIVLNYVNVLPGGTNNWYLIGGIGAIVVGLFMATFYH